MAVKEKRVKVKLPRIIGKKEQPDYVIGLNGKNIEIQRGVEVEIPVAYAKQLERMTKRKEASDEYFFKHAKD